MLNFFSESADEAYAIIRASTSDVETIAKNTAIKPDNIAKVKAHLFYNEHWLDRYTDYGIPAEMKKFDSDLAIANAWKRLEVGQFIPEDMALLKHEMAEAWYMRKHGPSYSQAHNAAQRRFPAPILETS